MGNAANLRALTADFEWNSVDMGYTKGGLSLKIDDKVVELTVDQWGDTLMDAVNSGRRVEVEATLAETVNGTMAKVLGDAIVSGQTFRIGNPIGGSKRSQARTLVIKPRVGGVPSSSTSGYWRTFETAVPLATIEESYDGKQNVYKTKWLILMRTSDNTFGVVGDPALAP